MTTSDELAVIIRDHRYHRADGDACADGESPPAEHCRVYLLAVELDRTAQNALALQREVHDQEDRAEGAETRLAAFVIGDTSDGYPSEIWWRNWSGCIAETVRRWHATAHPDRAREAPDGFAVTAILDRDHPHRLRTVTVTSYDRG